MYWKVKDVKNIYPTHDNDRPFIWCEYSHAMGNSNGNFKEYWDYVRSHPNIQRWIHLGLDGSRIGKKDAKGNSYWAYGGHFEPEATYTDKNFCLNGIISSDWTPHPAAYEIKHVYQDIHFTKYDLDKKELTIKNEFFFRDLSGYTFNYQLQKDGVTIAEKSIKVPNIGPQEEATIDLDLGIKINNTKALYTLNVFAKQKNPQPFIHPGDTVAYHQFILNEKRLRITRTSTPKPLAMSETDNSLTLSSNGNCCKFSKETGLLSSILSNGVEYLSSPLDRRSGGL